MGLPELERVHSDSLNGTTRKWEQPSAVAERRQAIASDFSPRSLCNEQAQAAERRQVQTPYTCRRSATFNVAKPLTDLGLKSEAITCRCSATL